MPRGVGRVRRSLPPSPFFRVQYGRERSSLTRASSRATVGVRLAQEGGPVAPIKEGPTFGEVVATIMMIVGVVVGLIFIFAVLLGIGVRVLRWVGGF